MSECPEKKPHSDEQAAAGEELEELMQSLGPKIQRIVGFQRIPSQDVEDLIQDTCWLFLTKWQEIDVPAGWFLATLQNRCRLYWRSKRRDTAAQDPKVLELLAMKNAQAPVQVQIDLRADIEQALRIIPERCQTLLRLRYGLGCRPTEVADRMGYRVSSIRKVHSRCLAALTRALIDVGYFSDQEEAPKRARVKNKGPKRKRTVPTPKPVPVSDCDTDDTTFDGD